MEARVISDLPRGQGSGCCRPGRRNVCFVFLEEIAFSTTIEPPSRQPTNWRTIISKKFSHCCKSSRAHNRFPNLGITQKDSEPPRETDSWRAQQKLVHTRTQEKGAVTPQETEPGLPVNVWESPAEVWVKYPAMGSGALITAVLGASF